ncbi:MAG: type II toxin-antitoxin system RelE/ParE family toxin [Candidatus Sulfotelmatobacter sp.]
MDIRYYITKTGKDAVDGWISGLADGRTEARIFARIERLLGGNFGDTNPWVGGVFELRIDAGPGYRIYYAMIGRTCVLLLCGGDKRKQSSDIQRARNYLKDYLERTRKQ